MRKQKCTVIAAGEPTTYQDGSWTCIAKVEPKDWTIRPYWVGIMSEELPRPPKVGDVVWVQPATVLGFVEEGEKGEA